MRNKLSKIALAATLGIALALTFSCSSGGGGNTHHTYYYSCYGVKNCSELETLASDPNFVTDNSFTNVKEAWSKIRRLDGGFIESGTGLTESDIKNFLVVRDVTPKEADGYMDLLKSRGNTIGSFNSSDYRYCSIIIYVEQE